MFWVGSHGITMICRNDNLPKLRKQLSRRKFMAIFNEDLLNIVLNLFLSSIHVAPKFVTAINFFLSPLKLKMISFAITFLTLLCGMYCGK